MQNWIFAEKMQNLQYFIILILMAELQKLEEKAYHVFYGWKVIPKSVISHADIVVCKYKYSVYNGNA